MTHIDSLTLKKLISRNLVIDDIAMLCDELGIDSINFSGGIVTRSYALVDYVDRAGQMEQLVKALQEKWPAIFRNVGLDTTPHSSLDQLTAHVELVEVAPSETGVQIAELRREVDDPQAIALLQKIEDLLERLVLLPDAVTQANSFVELEQVSRIMRSDPRGFDDWQLEVAKADYVVRRITAHVIRSEKILDWERQKVASEITFEKQRLTDERILTWLIPITLFVYALLIVATVLIAARSFSLDYVLPVIAVPVPVIVWAAVGAWSALMLRYYRRHASVTLMAELRIYIGRFWMGVIAGTIFYFAIRSGLYLLSNSIVDLNVASPGQQQILWVLVWLVAFSELIFERVVSKMAGSITGENSETSVENIWSVAKTEITELIDRATNLQRTQLRQLEAEIRALQKGNAPVNSPVVTPLADTDLVEPEDHQNDLNKDALAT